jgi:hypothetical protein
MELQILSENQIEVYSTPGTKIKQHVITYLAEGLAPRTIWVNADQLPDVVWQSQNPGKTTPKDIQASGDKIRRTLIELDIARISKTPQPRKI